MGRLTAHPELKKTQSGTSVCSFCVAVQRNYKDGNGEYQSDFIQCVAWRNTAEFISKFFEKGQLIGIVGSIQTRKYEDKEGNKKTAVEVIAEEASFADSKKENSQSYVKKSPDGEFEEGGDDEELHF